MTEPVLPEGILTLKRRSDVPLAEQIYRSIRKAVQSGLLHSGSALPSTRRLAASLQVGRNTVNTAYELLRAEGITRVKSGAAPRIANGMRLEGSSSSSELGATSPRLSRRGELMAANIRGNGWAFRHGALQPGTPALDCFPYEEWARSLRRAARLERSPDLQYRNFSGLPALKKRLARYLATERGVRAEPEQILITSSMQACLSLLSLALADPGDEAWLEEPGYLGARTAFHVAGLKVRPLPVDEEGADPGKLAQLEKPPRLIYVTPSHQYPLGTRMPLARRLALLDAAREAGAAILEDDYDSEFLFSGRPVAALQGLASEGQVVYLGTFSKSLMPGLRIAYCVVPQGLVASLEQFMRNMGCATNVQAQAALEHFMDCGAYQKHLKQIRRIYEARGIALVETLQARLGNRVDVKLPTGNVQVALLFREPIDDVSLAVAMQSKGFAVSPMSNCYLGRDAKAGLIIGFAGAQEKEMVAGIDTLSSLLENGDFST
ncbi:HTH-type transcriptional regulatory protein GabR [Labrenzia sp. THAF82]|uniref:MocR-like pyridoxine biosynthesis transcription factor PdxR n=1 Tax=Labrenzia sp. THAF82 TaxID=2587861 RepID=UPI001267E3CE|nr:PLP-dependent aminotransferase family protein [Labrenzia sp. THAF82]QFT31020.1 HTH-type transcriptional regulatory protein GabR [Labrenzia sp. THAF82]